MHNENVWERHTYKESKTNKEMGLKADSTPISQYEKQYGNARNAAFIGQKTHQVDTHFCYLFFFFLRFKYPLFIYSYKSNYNFTIFMFNICLLMFI